MRLFVTLTTLLLLSGCAQTQLASHVYKTANPPQQGTFKVGKPYKVDGKTYTPRETYSYSETGIASWYGPGFHGKQTANGERFDSNELTAAHRTLQMPSLARVTNLDNGRSLVVRINDRGPFKRGRVIDVSQRAAELLGFKNIGTAKVRLDLLADESKTLAMAAKQGQTTRGMEVALNRQVQQAITAPESFDYIAAEAAAPAIPGHVRNGEFFSDPVVSQQPVQPTSIYIQAGSFSQSANADHLAHNLKTFGNTQVYPAVVNGQQFYRVRVGPVASVQAADSLLARMGQAGYAQAIIIVD